MAEHFPIIRPMYFEGDSNNQQPTTNNQQPYFRLINGLIGSFLAFYSALGLWLMAQGSWLMTHGSWPMTHGLWLMAHGQ